MKTIFQLFLIILLFEFSNVKAQQSDNTISARLPLMKSKSQIFIAEVKTNVGITKGILYEADSSGIVILDSLFKKVEISILDIKVLTIRRINATGFGFKTGFYSILVPSLILEVVWVAAGAAAPGAGLAAFLLIITPLAGLGFGVILGGIVAIASYNIPNQYINLERYPNEYLNQLKYIKTKTQQVLTKKYPQKVRLI